MKGKAGYEKRMKTLERVRGPKTVKKQYVFRHHKVTEAIMTLELSKKFDEQRKAESEARKAKKQKEALMSKNEDDSLDMIGEVQGLQV